MTTASPIQQKERAIIVDVVRGFALTGVLIANFTGYNYQNLPSTVFHANASPFDEALNQVNTVFFEWKFMTIFSVLFGYGFGLLLNSFEKKALAPTPYFIRRMCWLFVLGIIHTLFWWGDVLHLYAVAGLLLFLFRKTTTFRILVFSMLCMFVVPPLISFGYQDRPSYFTDENLQVLYEQYKYGSWMDVWKQNMVFYYKSFILGGGDWHDVAETLGRFLFGYYLLRIRLFDSIATKKAVFRTCALLSTPFMVAYFLLRWQSLKGNIVFDPVAGEFFFKLGVFFTSCCYTSTLTLLYIKWGASRFFSAWQALGKMTLTNYLLISVCMITLLYGIGFGQIGELPMHTVWLLALFGLGIVILFSQYWLKRFRYGPAEWIWRQLTYNQTMPLKK